MDRSDGQRNWVLEHKNRSSDSKRPHIRLTLHNVPVGVAALLTIKHNHTSVQSGNKFTSTPVFRFGTKLLGKCVMVARNLIVGIINHVSLLSCMLFCSRKKPTGNLKK